MLFDEDTERRINSLMRATAESYALFLLGRDLGMKTADAVSRALRSRTVPGAFLDVSYLAGKAAKVAGPDALKTMSPKEMELLVERLELTLTDADRAKITQLKRETARSLETRSQAWQGKIRQAFTEADSAWRATLSTNVFTNSAARATARDAALRNVVDRLRDEDAGMQSDVSKIVQTEMNRFFQNGMTSGQSKEAIVYKVPRMGACKECYRLTTRANGSPRLFRLADVEGNSNVGLPAAAWTFTIGPIHPWCYCILYFAEDTKPQERNRRRAQARRERLSKATYSSTCGFVSPDTMFEEQIFNGEHEEEIPEHRSLLIEAVRGLYGEQLPFS